MRALVLGTVVATVVLAGAARADAHDPIIFTPEQTTPAAGPRLPDGTISFALYGTVAGGTDSRGFRAQLRAGQRLELTLLIPDLAPERDLSAAELPILMVAAPDGTTSERRPDRRERFTESFSGTSYVRLLEVAERVAATGEFAITVTGTTAARFTVAIGSIERFGTPVEAVPNRDEGVAGVRRWYATAPVATTTAATPSTITLPGRDTTAPSTVRDPEPSTTAATATTAMTTAPPTMGGGTTTATTAAPVTASTRSSVPAVAIGVVIGIAAGGMLALRTRRARRTRS